MWFLALKFFMRETFSRYSLWIAQENTNKTSKKEVKDYFRCQMEQEIVCVVFVLALWHFSFSHLSPSF